MTNHNRLAKKNNNSPNSKTKLKTIKIFIRIIWTNNMMRIMNHQTNKTNKTNKAQRMVNSNRNMKIKNMGN